VRGAELLGLDVGGAGGAEQQQPAIAIVSAAAGSPAAR
jgi:hypothetical protein